MRLLHAHARNEMLYCAPTGVQMFRCIPQLTAACLVSTSIGKHLGSRCPGLRWNGVHLGFVSLPVAAFTGSGYKFLFSFALFYKWGELAPGMCFFFFLIYTGTFIIYILYVSFFWHEDSSLLTQFFQLCLGVTLVATVLFHFHSFCLHAASDAASSVPDVTYGNALYTCRIPCYERWRRGHPANGVCL